MSRRKGHYIIGIDFGTTYSSIFQFDEKKNAPIGLTGSCSSYFYPTVISYSKGSWYFGEQALKKNQCILDLKRMFGILEDSPLLNEVKKIWAIDNITLRKSEDKGLIEIALKSDPKSSKIDEWVTPDEIAAKFIRYLFNDNNIPISRQQKVVVTCPADFNTIQRKVLMNAMETAGFSSSSVFLLHEPSAASISYMQDSSSDCHYNNFLVCDFGGGTLDLSLLDISPKSFTIKNLTGNRYLGGRDFDNAIFEWSKKTFERNLSRKLTKSELKQIKKQCQDAKIALNINSHVSIDITDEDEEENSITLTRTIFEDLAKPLLDEAIKVIDNFISKQARISKSSVDAIFLVGGTSNLYLFRQRIKQLFNKNPIDYQMQREAVARGACYFAAMIEDAIDSPLRDLNFNQRLSHSIGTDVYNDDNKAQFSEIIPKNSKIPVSGTKSYISSYDNQKELHVGVYESDEIYLNNCIPIDEFNQKIKPLPKGKARITVTMSIDSNGILKTTSVFKNLEIDEYDSDYDVHEIQENLNLSDSRPASRSHIFDDYDEFD